MEAQPTLTELLLQAAVECQAEYEARSVRGPRLFEAQYHQANIFGWFMKVIPILEKYTELVKDFQASPIFESMSMLSPKVADMTKNFPHSMREKAKDVICNTFIRVGAGPVTSAEIAQKMVEQVTWK